MSKETPVFVRKDRTKWWIIAISIVAVFMLVTMMFGRWVPFGSVAATYNSVSAKGELLGVSYGPLVYEWPTTAVEMFQDAKESEVISFVSADGLLEIAQLSVKVTDAGAIEYFKKGLGRTWNETNEFSLARHAARQIVTILDQLSDKGALEAPIWEMVSSETVTSSEAVAHYDRGDPGGYDYDCAVEHFSMVNAEELIESYQSAINPTGADGIVIEFTRTSFEVERRTELPCGYTPPSAIDTSKST